MTEIAGRVALITGASRGIGRATAIKLASYGVRLGLASRSESSLELPQSLSIRCDVRDRAQVKAAVEAVVEHFGGLDILIANAGVGAYGPFSEIDPENLEEILDVNVKGFLYSVQEALPHLLRAVEADIVTIASDAGRRGLSNQAVYCASKFAQVGFMRALDNELREAGVRCTNLCPGGVATDFAIGRGRSRDMPELAGMMGADDIADVVLFALSRPRGHRILEVAFRAMSERSWG